MPAKVNCYVLEALIKIAKESDVKSVKLDSAENDDDRLDMDLILALAEDSLRRGDPNG